MWPGALGSDLVFCFRQDPGLDSGNLFPQLLILGRLSPDSTSQVADALRSSRSQPSRELWQGCRNRPPGRPRRCRPREVFFPSLGKDLGINPAVSGHSCRHRFRLDRTRSSRPRDLVGIWRGFHRLANAVGKTLPAQQAAGHGPRRGDFRRRLEAWRHGALGAASADRCHWQKWGLRRVATGRHRVDSASLLEWQGRSPAANRSSTPSTFVNK